MSDVAVLETKSRPPLLSGGRVRAIVPQSMEEAYRLANAVCMAGMAPKGLDTPEKAMIAIMHGMEVGLPPMMALQRIAVVNGRPTIWGDAAMGLVRASGLAEWISEKIEGIGDTRAATCEAKRRGEPKATPGRFSVSDAKKAGLWGKTGPWQQYPDRMLQMRARGFCLRDGFADVLGGLYLREEIDEDQPSSSGAPMPPAPPAALSAPSPPTAASPPPQPEQSVPAGFSFDAFRAALDATTTLEEANAIYDREVTNRIPSLHGDEMDEADSILRECASKFYVPEE